MKLADVNLLVAMAFAPHPHHAAAATWRKKHRFATCPITELGMVRVLMQLGADAGDAMKFLESVKADADFVPCDVPATVLDGAVTHHRHTTDVYLLALARAHKLTLATFDAGIKGAELVKS